MNSVVQTNSTIFKFYNKNKIKKLNTRSKKLAKEFFLEIATFEYYKDITKISFSNEKNNI